MRNFYIMKPTAYPIEPYTFKTRSKCVQNPFKTRSATVRECVNFMLFGRDFHDFFWGGSQDILGAFFDRGNSTIGILTWINRIYVGMFRSGNFFVFLGVVLVMFWFEIGFKGLP